MKQQDVIEFFDQAAAGWDAQLRRNEPVIARILDNAGAVSYTHLDVYKRQLISYIHERVRQFRNVFNPTHLCHIR